MADFDVAPAAGLQLLTWEDPVGPNGEPSRLLPHPGVPLKRYKAVRGQLVRLEAVVNGNQAPIDTLLGGRFFSADLVEGSQPRWVPPPGGGSSSSQSSVVRFYLDWIGHHVIAVRRAGGGAVLVPIDVEAT